MQENSIQGRLVAEALTDHDTSALSRLAVIIAAEKDKYPELEKLVNLLAAASRVPEHKIPEAVADLRLLHLLLRKCRYYGTPQHGGYYGLDIADGKQAPRPMLVLLGDNGVGKSSVFGAAEYKSTQTVGEASLRKLSVEQYLGSASDVRFVFSDQEQNVDQYAINLHPFFITENSIMELAEYMRTVSTNNDWYYFFCHLLDFDNDLVDFAYFEKSKVNNQWKTAIEVLNISGEDKAAGIKVLTDIIDDICLSDTLDDTDKKEVTERIERLTTMIGQVSDNGYEAFTGKRELLGILRRNIPACREAYETIHKIIKYENGENKTARVQNAVRTLIERLQRIVADKPDFKELKRSVTRREELQRYDGEILKGDYEKLKKDVETIRGHIAESVRRFVLDIIDDEYCRQLESLFNGKGGHKLFLRDDEVARFSVEKKSVRMEVNDKPVHTYFNTFRYRLFCLACQALACVKIMKEQRFRFPLFLDDVFFASDYRNRSELAHFFMVLFKAAEKMIGEQLQIVFLTHDEQLVASLHTELRNAYFGRMLTPKLAEECEQCRRETQDGENRYTNLYIPIYV